MIIRYLSSLLKVETLMFSSKSFQCHTLQQYQKHEKIHHHHDQDLQIKTHLSFYVVHNKTTHPLPLPTLNFLSEGPSSHGALLIHCQNHECSVLQIHLQNREHSVQYLKKMPSLHCLPHPDCCGSFRLKAAFSIYTLCDSISHTMLA